MKPVDGKTPPAESDGLFVVAHSDGAARGNPGPAGIGVVLASNHGEPITTYYQYIGRATNNEAEYMAAITAMDLALQHGAQRFQLCTDSELLARQLAGHYQVRSPVLKPLFERARGLLSRFQSSAVTHISREQNRPADALANKAIDEALNSRPRA